MSKILDPNAADAATMHSWSDRNPATIVKRTERTIIVQEDRTAPMGGSYAEGHGKVDVFTRDYDSPLVTYTLRRNGRWVRKGTGMNERGGSLSIGARRYYRDPSF